MLAQATALQKTAVSKIHNLFETENAVLVQAMTGAGKTYIGFEFIREYLMINPLHKVMIVVPTVALVEQFHETANRFGFIASVYHNDLKHRLDDAGEPIPMEYLANTRICITLPDTFANLLAGKHEARFDPSWIPTLLMMDEAHKNTSTNSQAFKGWAPLAKVLGFTATPRREQNENGEYLIDWYGDNLLIAALPEELIEANRIVRPKIFEFNESHNEFDEWEALTRDHSNKSTMIIARDTNAAAVYCSAFRKRFPHLVVELITSVGSEEHEIRQQSPKKRQEIQNSFKRGDIDVLVSVDTVCEGFDAPRAKFLMVQRRMTSESLYHQVVGRVLRTYTDPTGEVKDFGYVMDFGGNHARYGSVTEKVWTPKDYAPETSIVKPSGLVSPAQYAKATTLITSCRVCDKVFDAKARVACPACRTQHNVRIAVKVKDIYLKVYNMVDINAYSIGALQKMFAFRHYEKNMYEEMRLVFNDIFKTEVFTKTGANPAHGILKDLLQANAKLGETVEIALNEKFILDAVAA